MGKPGAESEPSKRCTKCGEVKPLDAFARRGEGRRQSWCRACVSARDREVYRRDQQRRSAVAAGRRTHKARNVVVNRAYLLEHLRSHPCVDCGEGDLAVLEFDHVRGEKEHNISRMMEMSPRRLRAEVGKCEIRCGNCHRRRTAIEKNWWIHQAVERLRREGRLPS